MSCVPILLQDRHTRIPVSYGRRLLLRLQPALSEPMYAIWEIALVSCPQCGYTTYGPSSLQRREPSPALVNYVRDTLTPFVKRQKPSLTAQPSLTSKYELYALELDFQGADDHLIADQFLRASWSARIRGRSGDARRLRSLAASYYEKALTKTAKQVVEEEIMVRYLLTELYRLLGEEGKRRTVFEQLVLLRGESIQGDTLIEVAEQQFEKPREDETLRTSAGTMDFIGSYRGSCLVSHAYVALRSGDPKRAQDLFLRVLGFCEGPLRTRLYLLEAHAGLVMSFKLDDFGARAAIGLRETCRRIGINSAHMLAWIDPLVRGIEKKWAVSADEICRHNVSTYELPRKPGWRHINRRIEDPKPHGRVAWSKEEPSSGNVKELINKAQANYNGGAFHPARAIATEAVAICSKEMQGLDPATDEHLELASLKIKAHRIAAMSELRAGGDEAPIIRNIERALEEYQVIGGPKTAGTFAFLLNLLAIAFERKHNVLAAREALQKALQLTERDPAATFHYGRQLLEFPPSAAGSEPVLKKA
jgi:tetratricopeptide (TPR) repeat protein